ncbi:hypothetical protein [Rhizohabitans arisaemae]|nr:hypothetical protein [Rhizohabitans arisaemae]
MERRIGSVGGAERVVALAASVRAHLGQEFTDDLYAPDTGLPG